MLERTRRPIPRLALAYLLLIGLVVVGLQGGWFAPASTSATPDPDPGPPRPAAAPAAAAARTEHPMDEPLRLLARAQQAFAGVQDYPCTLITQEPIKGTPTPLHVISLSIRNQPFSVYLQWHQPRESVGQEVCYVAGKNEGKMRAKSAGFAGTFGFVSIDPDDPRAKKTSSHS